MEKLIKGLLAKVFGSTDKTFLSCCAIDLIIRFIGESTQKLLPKYIEDIFHGTLLCSMLVYIAFQLPGIVLRLFIGSQGIQVRTIAMKVAPVLIFITTLTYLILAIFNEINIQIHLYLLIFLNFVFGGTYIFCTNITLTIVSGNKEKTGSRIMSLSSMRDIVRMFSVVLGCVSQGIVVVNLGRMTISGNVCFFMVLLILSIILFFCLEPVLNILKSPSSAEIPVSGTDRFINYQSVPASLTSALLSVNNYIPILLFHGRSITEYSYFLLIYAGSAFISKVSLKHLIKNESILLFGCFTMISGYLVMLFIHTHLLCFLSAAVLLGIANGITYSHYQCCALSGSDDMHRASACATFSSINAMGDVSGAMFFYLVFSFFGQEYLPIFAIHFCALSLILYISVLQTTENLTSIKVLGK